MKLTEEGADWGALAAGFTSGAIVAMIALIALDARAGDLLWIYERELPEDLVAFHDTNRGVALYEDKVFTATLDAHVLAFEALTGEVLWDTQVEDNSTGYYITLAPLAAASFTSPIPRPLPPCMTSKTMGATNAPATASPIPAHP